MATLVSGGTPTLRLVHEVGPFASHHDLVVRLGEVIPGDSLDILSSGEQRGLVDQVGKVRAGETDGSAHELVEIDVVSERHFA